ncbi:tetratricopeptide repeat protein [Pasteurellaceae bacterium LIM206]|nr:tetratricopeptide repeat protein [Pasteurellaceae bacterium LIM206]
MKTLIVSTALLAAAVAFAANLRHPPFVFDKVLAAALKGDTQAEAELGEAYLMGNGGLAVNYTQALQWTEKAADKNVDRANRNLGIQYLYGYGTGADYGKAKLLLEKAAAQGDRKASRYLGFIYRDGLGVKPDAKKAAEYFQKGDETGDISSRYALAKLYEQGLGVPQDYAKAIELYKKDQNRIDHITAPSFIALGDLYAKGLGVKKDLAAAKQWYEKAVLASSTEAQQRLGTIEKFTPQESLRAKAVKEENK